MARRKNKTTIQEAIAKLIFIFVALLFLISHDKTISVFKIVVYSGILLFVIVIVASFFLKNIAQKKTNVHKKEENRKKTHSVEKPYYQTNCEFHHKSRQKEKTVRAQPEKESDDRFKPHFSKTAEMHNSIKQKDTEKELYDRFKPDFSKNVKKNNDIKQKDTNTWTIKFLKLVEWKRFEELCVTFLKFKGYNADLTCLGADEGIDIKIYDNNSHDNLYAIVQCKSYTSYNIGVKLVRELYGVMNDKNVKIGIFITTSFFTSEARKFAKGKQIQLINGQGLIDKINNLETEQRRELYTQITTGDYTTPSCPRCGCKMIMRTNRKNSEKKFWGCQNYPRCRSTMRCNKKQQAALDPRG